MCSDAKENNQKSIQIDKISHQNPLKSKSRGILGSSWALLGTGSLRDAPKTPSRRFLAASSINFWSILPCLGSVLGLGESWASPRRSWSAMGVSGKVSGEPWARFSKHNGGELKHAILDIIF